MKISLALLSLCALIGAVVLAAPSPRVDSHVTQTRKYDLEITKGYNAPDGITRMAYLVNGQTPGPEIRARQGDDLEISVTNASPVNFTIHFHGIEQEGTPWSDGVPGVTQRMISPGQIFVYRWKATQSGLYWYHAHSRELYDDGIRGAIYLEPNDSQPTPFGLISSDPQDISAMKSADKDPRVVGLSDRKHFNSERDFEEWQRTHIEQLCVDSLLINGRGRIFCPPQETFAPYITPTAPTFTARGCLLPNNSAIYPYPDGRPDLIDPGVFYDCQSTTTPFSVVSVDPESKWASLAFVNMAGLWQIKVSVDSHKLYVYSADGQYHKPQAVDIITIPIGQRFQAMIKLDQPVADYTIRIAVDEVPQVMSGFAVLSYTKSSIATVDSLPPDVDPAMAYGGLVLNNSTTTLDAMTLKPFPETLAPPKDSTHTFLLDLNRTSALTWTLNRDPYQPFLELITPLLLAPQDASKLDPSIVFSYPLGSVIDMIFQATPGAPAHPLHKHGKSAWIIGIGNGPFAWDSVATAMKEQPSLFNLIDPPLRDGFNTLDATTEPTFLVIRYLVTNPMVTFIHCHINNHVIGGMASVLMEGVDKLPPIPSYYTNAGL
ncbi:hypothetical protein BOTBODRAFT_28712 [Botryobasidium botryosum FD-172 SS1]|uniref:Multicopper oxidase n=1 Tax=Botryobasidium botryosum (strain FD-172 SS1) TaxID=930990 RepID=A0A067MRE9_BOTB1|nr:hypothetical protein BOTBODRAFT_28712 [Botryobasidium botryosum FD-172 SS1]